MAPIPLSLLGGTETSSQQTRTPKVDLQYLIWELVSLKVLWKHLWMIFIHCSGRAWISFQSYLTPWWPTDIWHPKLSQTYQATLVFSKWTQLKTSSRHAGGTARGVSGYWDELLAVPTLGREGAHWHHSQTPSRTRCRWEESPPQTLLQLSSLLARGVWGLSEKLKEKTQIFTRAWRAEVAAPRLLSFHSWKHLLGDFWF